MVNIKSLFKAVAPPILSSATSHVLKARKRKLFFQQLRRYENLSHEKLDRNILYPCLYDDIETSGYIGGLYTYQDTWAARLICEKRPAQHVDVASSAAFVVMTSVFTKIVSVEFRPFVTSLPNLESRSGDVCRMPFENNSVASLSSLSVLEHIGLGRYGDPIDPQGTVKAAAELERVLMPGGDLYVAVPTQAWSRIHFNAHRTHTPEDFIALFPGCRLVEETYAQQDGYLDRAAYDQSKRPYSYGCFHFTK